MRRTVFSGGSTAGQAARPIARRVTFVTADASHSKQAKQNNQNEGLKPGQLEGEHLISSKSSWVSGVANSN